MNIPWLVLSTPLNIMKITWDDSSQSMEKSENVPNQQPVGIIPGKSLGAGRTKTQVAGHVGWLSAVTVMAKVLSTDSEIGGRTRIEPMNGFETIEK